GAIALAHGSQERDRRITTFVLQRKLDNLAHGPLPRFYRRRIVARERGHSTRTVYLSLPLNRKTMPPLTSLVASGVPTRDGPPQACRKKNGTPHPIALVARVSLPSPARGGADCRRLDLF